VKTLFDTTITDKPIFTVKIIDTVKYGKLSDSEKIIFQTLRNSLLEIMPSDGTYSDEAIRYAENYAFINLKVFTTNITKLIDDKISALQDSINIKLNSLNSTVNSEG
jgi:hypothetical protein